MGRNFGTRYRKSTSGRCDLRLRVSVILRRSGREVRFFPFFPRILPLQSKPSFYTEIVRRTTDRLHEVSPGSQTSVCVAWSPDDIDGRAYDVVGLANASDLLYVMSYDTRSQIFDRCIASANSPASRARYGLQRYLDLGISPKKLILGTPYVFSLYPFLLQWLFSTQTHTGGTDTTIRVRKA